MLKHPEEPGGRDLHTRHLETDLVVVGGGMAGTCCAITAAREGAKVVLLQDRPVLGGNASSEVRLWILGATSHMGNNNRWAREGGVIDEILVENTYRNPEGNPVILDSILIEKVAEEPNITLLLNTAVFEVTKQTDDIISSVRAFCSQNSTMYDVSAGLYVDASGDGIVGFMAGAAFRMGAEASEEFGERLAPPEPRHQLLGHSIYFYSKDVGRPTRFVAPSFALKDITQIPSYRRFNTKEHGCELWWIEHGGLLDTVHDAERIKWELWQIVYGVWDHIKNSGDFPEAENLTLEWVGTIPGKRESRRFEGDYMLSQQDIVKQHRHRDAVSYGGWAIDLHPAEGVYGDGPPCTQWHSKGVYQIPYRSLFSRNIRNLFLAGRIISVSHVAFGSTRVMATCAHNAQAVGMAAVMCADKGLMPRDLLNQVHMKKLQSRLIRGGQYIPGIDVQNMADMVSEAEIVPSSTYELNQLESNGESLSLTYSQAMLIAAKAGRVPEIGFWLTADESTELELQLRVASREGNYTPDVILATKRVALEPTITQAEITIAGRVKTGRSRATSRSVHGAGSTTATGRLSKVTTIPVSAPPKKVMVDFDVTLEHHQYIFICLMANPAVSVGLSDHRVTGILRTSHKQDRRVSKGATQTPPEGLGIDSFEFWLPERRPGGKNLAMTMDPPIKSYSPNDIAHGPDRPTTRPNAWVADPCDLAPRVTLTWKSPRKIKRLEFTFDTDADHPMESVLMGHPETVMPACVRNLRIKDQSGRLLGAISGNCQTRRTVLLDSAIQTDRIVIEVDHPSDNVPAALFRVRCFNA